MTTDPDTRRQHLVARRAAARLDIDHAEHQLAKARNAYTIALARLAAHDRQHPRTWSTPPDQAAANRKRLAAALTRRPAPGDTP